MLAQIPFGFLPLSQLPLESPVTDLARFTLYGFEGGKSPVYVRSWARSTWIQYTTLPARDTTGRTGDGRYLLGR